MSLLTKFLHQYRGCKRKVAWLGYSIKHGPTSDYTHLFNLNITPMDPISYIESKIYVIRTFMEVKSV
jgi:hypothetical protein